MLWLICSLHGTLRWPEGKGWLGCVLAQLLPHECIGAIFKLHLQPLLLHRGTPKVSVWLFLMHFWLQSWMFAVSLTGPLDRKH